jgi:hypothetical protein
LRGPGAPQVGDQDGRPSRAPRYGFPRYQQPIAPAEVAEARASDVLLAAARAADHEGGAILEPSCKVASLRKPDEGAHDLPRMGRSTASYSRWPRAVVRMSDLAGDRRHARNPGLGGVRGPVVRPTASLLTLIAMILVACGIPTPPTSSPSSSAIATLEVPTPEPSRTVHVREVPCPTSFGLAGATMPPIPATQTATLTADVTGRVTYYGNGTLTLLGPKGWHCQAAIGANGSGHMSITPPGQPVPSASPPPDGQAVTMWTGGACVACVASIACGLFPEAGSLITQPDFSCPTRPPGGEQVTRPKPRSAVFGDPPGVAGTGEPSGGRYRAFGFVVFDPGAAVGGTGRTVPLAIKVTCTLPDAMAQICDELVEGLG